MPSDVVSRIRQLSAHLDRSISSKNASVFENIPLAPADPIFALNGAYKADTDPKKVNLGIGAYRTDEGKPWVLPAVKKVRLCHLTALNRSLLNTIRLNV